MSGNDLGTLEQLDSVSVNSLVKEVRKAFIDELAKGTIVVGKSNIKLTTSRTGQGGTRVWFVCPRCKKRTGMLYKTSISVACRFCSKQMYFQQRYKGMTETNLW